MNPWTAGVPSAPPPPLPPHPTRLYIQATIWVAAALAAALAVAVLLDLSQSRHLANPQLGDPRIATLLTTTALGAVLLLGARQQARSVGRGDIRVGLGAGPIRRPLLLLLLAVLTVFVPPAWILALRPLLHPQHQAEGVTEMVRASTNLGPAIQLTTWFVMVALAPMAEELFFRGWLWTGLRRRWSLPAVIAGTSLPWLALHMPDGALRPLFLLPAALLFSLARQCCGGVWASLTLHLVNNAVSVAVLTLALQR